MALTPLARTVSKNPRPASPEQKTSAGELWILPGQWRPYFPFEQIAWIRAPWSSPLFPDYIWLDFPEAIFCDSGLIFLSHVNPGIPSMYPDLPKIDWQVFSGGIRFERMLPNGVKFGGALRLKNELTVIFDLFIRNDGKVPLKNITLQTCAYLKDTAEFAERTHENKFVHHREKGWMDFNEAIQEKATGRFRLGWSSGPQVADLPVIVTLSSDRKRLVAMTWYDDTFSLIQNPNHPCMHADPFFPNLAPGQEHRIEGALIFFDGDLEQFTVRLKRNTILQKNKHV